MGIRALWGRITGADKKKQFPDQQSSFLGRVGDYIIIYPYGLYCDLPDSVMLRGVGENAAIPVTVSRPAASRGEVILFNPVTGAKIVMNNTGGVDITADTMTLNGNLVVNGTMTNNGKDVGETHGHTQANDSGGSSEADINGVI